MKRVLIAAAVVAVLLVAVVIVLPRETGTTAGSVERTSPLAPIAPDEVTKLVLRHKVGQGEARQEQTVVLVRGEAEAEGEPAWRLSEPVEYEANQGSVKTLLTRLGELELRDVASEQATSHRDLEVDDENGIFVQAYAGDSRVADFVIGRYRGGNTMVRLAGSDAVWRASGSLRYVFGKNASDWREKAIFDFEREAITHVEFHNDGGRFVFDWRAPEATDEEESGEGAWRVTSVDAVAPPPAAEEGSEAPAGAPTKRVSAIEDFDTAKVRSLVTTLARLRATDFQDRTEGVETGLGEDEAARVVFSVGSGEAATSHALLLGAEHERSVFARRDDRDQVFLVSKSLADRLRPSVADFQKRAPSATKAPGPGPAALGGGDQVPPEVMRAAQQEMQRQQLLKQLSEQGVR